MRAGVEGEDRMAGRVHVEGEDRKVGRGAREMDQLGRMACHSDCAKSRGRRRNRRDVHALKGCFRDRAQREGKMGSVTFVDAQASMICQMIDQQKCACCLLGCTAHSF